MIAKLRRRFILLSALSVFFVLFLTIGVINVSNYVSIENDAATSLNEIISQGPQPAPFRPGPGQNFPERILRQHYFVVRFDEEGNVESKDTQQMFILSEQECVDLASRVYRNELTGGRYGDFRYQKATDRYNAVTVAFIDQMEKFDNAKRFLLVSFLVSLGAYAVLIVLIIFASKIAFKSAEEAYRKQKRFITNASHELKTPITVISADLDLIEMDSGSSEWSASIRDQLSRLTEMTNQLVTLSRLQEEDPTKYPFEDFSLNEVCKKAVASFSPLFEKENIKFAYNFQGNVTMHGNARLIDELIRIFLSNSLKYTGGEQKSSYFVVSESAKGKIELRFSNTLDKDDQVDVKQIFDRFYRSPSSSKEGSGVGLSIAQEIIELHHGKISTDKTDHVISFLVTFN